MQEISLRPYQIRFLLVNEQLLTNPLTPVYALFSHRNNILLTGTLEYRPVCQRVNPLTPDGT